MSQINMTEEEIKALQLAKEESDKRAEEAEAATKVAVAEAEKAKSDVTGVVDELKEERRKKAEAIEKAQIINTDEPVNVNEAIQKALEEKDTAKQKQELEQAIVAFQQSKTEFSSDPTGLVFEKFKQSLSGYNLSNVSNRVEATQALERIYSFNKFSEGKPEEEGAQYVGTPAGVPGTPAITDDATARDAKLSENANMSTDKVKALQEKFPEAFDGLGIN